MYSVTVHELDTKECPAGLSPVEQYLPNGNFRAVRILKCDWGDRYTLLDELAGEVYPYNQNTGAIAYAANVRGWGKTSNGPWFRSSSARWPSGGGPAFRSLAYEYALLEVFYGWEGPTFVNNQYFLSEQILPYIETINVPTGGMTWGTSGDPLRKGGTGYHFLPKRVHGIIYEPTFHYVNAAPPTAGTLQGCCNNAPLGSWTLGLVFDTGYLLYDHFKMRRSVSWAQLNTWQLTYSFIFRPHNWNTIWDPSTSTWDTVNYNGSQVVFHTPANLMLLYP